MSYKTRSRTPKQIKIKTEANRVLFEYSPLDETKEKITFTEHDKAQLQSPNYLNDTIISFFMQYYMDNSVDESLKSKVHVFSSFFLSKIKSIYSNKQCSDKATINGNCASRWLKGVKIFEKDFLFLPVCEDDHWLLAIVCYPSRVPVINTEAIPDEKLREPAVFVLNSMKTPPAAVKKVLQRFLTNQWRIERNQERSFAIHNAKPNGIRLLFPEVPQQKNNYNCGVYLLNYFKCFLRSPRESYIRMFRQRSLLDWFETNEIRTQGERSSMTNIVKAQMLLWDTPKKKAKRELLENDLHDTQDCKCSLGSLDAVIEIN